MTGQVTVGSKVKIEQFCICAVKTKPSTALSPNSATVLSKEWSRYCVDISPILSKFQGQAKSQKVTIRQSPMITM